DDDGRFLALELVHRPDADTGRGQPLLQAAHLGVVGRDNQDVLTRHDVLFAVFVDPPRGRCHEARYQRRDSVDLLLRPVAIAVVVLFDDPEAAPVELADADQALMLEFGLRLEPALVEQLRSERANAGREASRGWEEVAAVR